MSFEESMAKLRRYIEKIEVDDDFMSDINANDLRAWSDEALEMLIYVKKLGYMEMFTNEDFLRQFFQTLYFNKSQLLFIDASL